MTEAWNSSATGACFFTGSNLLLPKKLLLAIGRFDRSWTCRTGEDRDLCRRWAEAGLKMAEVPEAVMGHAHRLGFRAFLRQHFHYGQGRWWTERRRRASGHGPPAWSGLGFYLGLLRYPWSLFPMFQAARISGLVVCAQVATAWGSIQARGASPPNSAGE